ncbi:MAG: P1 family peptidase [Anaerolineae bacterium]|nr:P1 family peptidase [Anaerolineae bacterium]
MRKRLRELGIVIGELPTGPYNAITDVPGVRVGHSTVIYDAPRVARTGVTMVIPRDDIWHDAAFAGYHSFNGNGEVTGLHWLEESGMLGSYIGLTNTHQVGLVRDTLVEYSVALGYTRSFLLPVVGETYDGWLNDINAFHLTKADVYAALDSASDGTVAEGNVGGGTGMVCHEFKGGIGTASRIVQVKAGQFVLGALVQANYGSRRLLRVDGVPVGRALSAEKIPVPAREPLDTSSIIIILATDAPLLAGQCKRLARRATVGLARVGGTGHNGSGDIFLAFATGNHLPRAVDPVRDLSMLTHVSLNPLFDAVAEVVEEAILNALCSAETMTGYLGRMVYALPQDDLIAVMRDYGRL